MNLREAIKKGVIRPLNEDYEEEQLLIEEKTQQKRFGPFRI